MMSAWSLPCVIGSVEDSFVGVLADSPASFASADTANTPRSCEEASSELASDACSISPGRAFVTAAVSRGEGLNWCGAVKVSSDVVVTLSFETFAHSELLVGCLAGCASLGMVALVSRGRSAMSRRTS